MIPQRIKSNPFIKKLAFLAMVLVMVTNANAQTVSTTEEEYNYLTVGYKIQLATGLDMKKGYEFLQPAITWNENGYTFELKQLLRTASKQSCAISIIIKSIINPYINYYLCIPFNNGTLLYKYQLSINMLDQNILKAYVDFLSVHVANWTLLFEQQIREKHRQEIPF